MYVTRVGVPELLIMGMLLRVATLPFWMFSIIDIVRSDFRDNDKMIWLLVVILLYTLGVVLYFTIGRRRKLPERGERPYEKGL